MEGGERKRNRDRERERVKGQLFRAERRVLPLRRRLRQHDSVFIQDWKVVLEAVAAPVLSGSSGFFAFVGLFFHLRVRGLGVRGLVLGLEMLEIRCISSMHLKHPVHRIIFK